MLALIDNLDQPYAHAPASPLHLQPKPVAQPHGRADLILVMEEKHKSRITAEFRGETRYKSLHVLDIPDDYTFMDPELVDLLRDAVEPLIENALSQR